MDLRILKENFEKSLSRLSEASNLGTITEAAPDYSKVDSILKGTYKRPTAQINPEIQKMANTLDTLVSKPFDHEQLEDILNALGPIEPQELKQVIDVMKNSGFYLETDGGNNPSYNLEVGFNNYNKNSQGVALGWSNDHWVAG